MDQHFNTKKVRLKHGPLRAPVPLVSSFQYQKGAIKTGFGARIPAAHAPFQYQKGAIKTKYMAATASTSVSFQYQKGAIKTEGRGIATNFSNTHFNTKKVRLKHGWHGSEAVKTGISIPKRCD